MNERERILDLVKKEIITAEEGLVLLENLAKQQSENSKHTTEDFNSIFSNDDIDFDQDDEAEDEMNSDTADGSGEDDEYSEILDDLDDQLSELKASLAETNELMADNAAKISAVQKQIDYDQEHITVLDAMEDLGSLTDEKREERNNAKSRVVELQQTIENLELAKQELNNTLMRLNHSISRVNRQRIKASIHFDQIKDSTSEAFNDFGGKISDIGSQVGGFVRDTMKSVVDNIDWNDVTIKVPGLTSTTFNHDFIFANNSATILDIKNANGYVNLHTWNQPDVKVSAAIKFYGKLDETDKLAAFTSRSRIDVTDDQIIFQVPNKRILANLDIYLPERSYDHVSLKLLNGAINLTDLKAKDVYLKTTNGKVELKNVTATMVEVEDVNGSVNLTDGDLREALFSTVNGAVNVLGSVQSSKLSTVNGTVKATFTGEDLHRIEASSVHGSVKVAVPADIGIKGEASSTFGRVNTRCQDLNVSQSESKTGASVDFNRGQADQQTVALILTTTSGSIYLKDND